jgi:hypothetical protein
MWDADGKDMAATGRMELAFSVCRIAATMLGIVMIIIGVAYLLRLVGAVVTNVRNPDEMSALVAHWTELIGEEALDIRFGASHIQGARVLSIIILGGAAVVLGWLSLGITLAGAKIISWTSGDREAIKKILRYSLGQEQFRRRSEEVGGTDESKA